MHKVGTAEFLGNAPPEETVCWAVELVGPFSIGFNRPEKNEAAHFASDIVLFPFPRYRTLLGVFHPEPGQVAFVLWFPRRAVALVASETRSSQPEWLRKVPAFESVPGC